MATRIAIVGCGQLAQMMAQAGCRLGFSFAFVALPGEDTRCVDALGSVVTYTAEMTPAQLFAALGQPAVITVEKEMVDTSLLLALAEKTRVYPSPAAVKITQNRIREKHFVRGQGIATAAFEIIESVAQLQALPARLGLPLYIKAAESGYDGYHQWRIRSPADLEAPSLQRALAQNHRLIAEKHVDYRREVSLIAARNAQGEVVLYPPMENRHEDGVLIATLAPAPDFSETLAVAATDMVNRLLLGMQYVGVLTVECFETSAGLVVNELAPRVHNSGHWTIEGAACSQFENHCRAITHGTLGSVAMTGVAGLVNMLGQAGDQATLSGDHCFYHSYGKHPRPRRKLGHVTVCTDTPAALKQQLNRIMQTLYADRYPLL